MKEIKKYYIVYQTINLVNNKIYIGVHETDLDFDGYIGCGVQINRPVTYKNPKTNFQYAVKKHGIKNFRRTILKVFDNIEDASDLERWLVTEDFVKRPDTYNMVVGGGNVFPVNNQDTYIYDHNGNFIKHCISRTEAALYIYGSKKYVGCISRSIITGMFCKQYQVSNTKLPFMKDYNIYKTKIWEKICKTLETKYGDNKLLNHFTNPRKVAQYDCNGTLIKIWESIGKCRRSGFTNVQAVCEGKRTTCKGYFFKFYND